MTTNYETAQVHADSEDRGRLQSAQIHATLAVADELRTLTEVLVQVVGFTGTPGRAFIRVFDEAP